MEQSSSKHPLIISKLFKGVLSAGTCEMVAYGQWSSGALREIIHIYVDKQYCTDVVVQVQEQKHIYRQEQDTCWFHAT